MRTLLKIQVPIERGNKAVKEGLIGRVLEATIADIKPECSYYFTEGGQRAAIAVFDLKDPTDIPRIAERLFQELSATVDFVPVMNAEELKTGLGKLR